MAAGARRSKVRGPGAASRIAQAKRGPAAAFPRPEMSSRGPRPRCPIQRRDSKARRPCSSFPRPKRALSSSQAQAALSNSRDQLARARDEMSRAQESERRMWEECQRLREQRDRFESHPVLGQILRARRRVKGLLARSAVDSEAE